MGQETQSRRATRGDTDESPGDFDASTPSDCQPAPEPMGVNGDAMTRARPPRAFRHRNSYLRASARQSKTSLRQL